LHWTAEVPGIEAASVMEAGMTLEPMMDGQSHEAPTLPERRGDPQIRLACISGKGGVGKTTLTISLAASFAELGLSVLAIDCDPQSNLTSGLGFEPYEITPSLSDVMSGTVPALEAVIPTKWANLWLMPATPDLSTVEAQLPSSISRETVLRDALRSGGVDAHFDVIILDTPPNFGLHTVNALAATRHVIVPLQMSGYAVKGLRELRRVMKAAQISLNPELALVGLVPTFVNSRTRMSREMLEALGEMSDILVFKARIPVTVKLQETSLFGIPITALARRSHVAEEYRKLATEVLAAVEPAGASDSAPIPLRRASIG
jgi:chromosome partitioning protein